jgi:hypothetical protein
MNRLRPHTIKTADGYTATESASGLVTISTPDGRAFRMLSNGRALTLSTLDGYLLAAGRDSAEGTGEHRPARIFGSASMMVAACAARVKA